MNIFWNYVSSFFDKKNPFKRPNLDMLKTLDLIIFNMDGVLRINNKSVDIAIESFNKIKKNNIPICILTNECRRSPKKMKKELKNMGYDLSNIHLISSNLLMLKKIEEICYDNRKQNFAIISNDSFNSYIQSNTSNKLKNEKPNMYYIDNSIYPNNIDYFIISSLDKEIFEEQKNIIVKWFLNNKTAKIIMTCPDEHNLESDNVLPKTIFNIYPTKDKEYEFVGKPNSKYILDEIKTYYGFSKLKNDNILMVGDSLDTDIKFSNDNKFKSSLVLSGITKLEDLNKENTEKIDYIIPDISYLCF